MNQSWLQNNAPWSVAKTLTWLHLPAMLLALSGCATPQLQPLQTQHHEPRLNESHVVMADDYALPLSAWQPEQAPVAVVLALHGFNDYRNAFSSVGPALAQHGIVTYAYDQRGFGETQWAGVWAGSERMTEDLEAMTVLLQQKHPGLPLYILGESMGGAVSMAALRGPRLPNHDGMILVAPAVWGRDTMNPVQRFGLWLAAHTAPAKKVTGKGLDITPSDNIEMLRALGRDPLVIKATRFDALYGITNLMDEALAAAAHVNGPTLILYGARDEIIPKRPICRMLANLPEDSQAQVVIYPDGYHMLTRDLEAEVVLHDIATWITRSDTPLPSILNSESSSLEASGLCNGFTLTAPGF